MLEVLNLPAEDRINIIEEGIWVRYRRADEIIKILERLSRQPKRTRMEGRSLIGDTGYGKTSIIEEFIRIQKYKSGVTDEPYFEYLKVEAPEIPSVKALYINIGAAINLPNLSGTAEQLKLIIIQALKQLNVKMLFIDEIHNLLTYQTRRILDQCRNALKGLSNRLKIPIVLIGTEEAEKVLIGDDQVLDRYPVVKLYPWEDGEDYRLLLDAFESALPLKKESNLAYDDNLAGNILELSGGKLGSIAKIIRECAIEAIERGTEKITKTLVIELHKLGYY